MLYFIYFFGLAGTKPEDVTSAGLPLASPRLRLTGATPPDQSSLKHRPVCPVPACFQCFPAFFKPVLCLLVCTSIQAPVWNARCKTILCDMRDTPAFIPCLLTHTRPSLLLIYALCLLSQIITFSALDSAFRLPPRCRLCPSGSFPPRWFPG